MPQCAGAIRGSASRSGSVSFFFAHAHPTWASRQVSAHELCWRRRRGAGVLTCRLLAHVLCPPNHGVFTKEFAVGGPAHPCRCPAQAVAAGRCRHQAPAFGAPGVPQYNAGAPPRLEAEQQSCRRQQSASRQTAAQGDGRCEPERGDAAAELQAQRHRRHGGQRSRVGRQVGCGCLDEAEATAEAAAAAGGGGRAEGAGEGDVKANILILLESSDSMKNDVGATDESLEWVNGAEYAPDGKIIVTQAKNSQGLLRILTNGLRDANFGDALDEISFTGATGCANSMYNNGVANEDVDIIANALDFAQGSSSLFGPRRFRNRQQVWLSDLLKTKQRYIWFPIFSDSQIFQK